MNVLRGLCGRKGIVTPHASGNRTTHVATVAAVFNVAVAVVVPSALDGNFKHVDDGIRDALLPHFGGLSDAESTAVERATGSRVAFANPMRSPYPGVELELRFIEGRFARVHASEGFVHGADAAAVCAYRKNAGRQGNTSVSNR